MQPFWPFEESCLAQPRPMIVPYTRLDTSPQVRMLFLGDAETLSDAVSTRHLCQFLRKPFRRSTFLGRVLETMDRPKVLTT
jgi:hypothetical protein